MANGSPEGVASSDGSEYVLGQVSGLGFGTIVFTGDHVGRWSPLETHLQKTTTHELGHLLGAGRADDENQFVVFPDESTVEVIETRRTKTSDILGQTSMSGV